MEISKNPWPRQVGVLAGGADPVILVVKKQQISIIKSYQLGDNIRGQKDPQTGKTVVRNIPLTGY